MYDWIIRSYGERPEVEVKAINTDGAVDLELPMGYILDGPYEEVLKAVFLNMKEETIVTLRQSGIKLSTSDLKELTLKTMLQVMNVTPRGAWFIVGVLEGVE